MKEIHTYTLDYFQTQLTFAQKLYQLSLDSNHLINWNELLKESTTLFRETTNKGNDTDRVEHWNKIVGGITNPSKIDQIGLAENLHLLYLQRDLSNLHRPENIFCLKTEYIPEKNKIQMHYVPGVVNGRSALSGSNRENRLNDYIDTFKNLLKTYPEETTIFGFSWLYNLEIYTWIFPHFKDNPNNSPAIGNRMYPKFDSRHAKKMLPMPLNSWVVWGQFLRKGYESNVELITSFVRSIDVSNSVEKLIDSFPYPVRYYEDTLQTWWKHLLSIRNS